MLLTVLGSNGTYPTPGRPASGYLVGEDDTSVLLDIGPGTFTALLERGVMPDAIVVSHRHADHCLDALPLFNHLRFDRPDIRRLPLVAPPGVYGRLAEFAGAGPGHAFHDVFDPRWVEGGDSMTIGSLRFSFGTAAHSVPSVCVRVEAHERVLAYSGDTGPGGDLTELAADAHVLLCEATFQGRVPSERFPHHLYASEAGEIAHRSRVGRLIVTHLAPTLEPAVSVAEAADVFDGPVAHAAPAMEVEV